MEQEHQREEGVIPDPIFFRKKSFTGEIKLELGKLRNAFEDRKEKVKDLWQATVKVVKERHETNLALNKSLFLEQNKKSEASSSDACRRNKNAASSVEFGPEMCDQAVDFYKMWIVEFKKNASRQREVVQDSVEKWFDFLHRFDDEESQPKRPVSEKFLSKCIYYLLVVLLFASCLLFIFGHNYDFLKCSDKLLTCLYEFVITLAFKMREFYFKFHDITADYSNASSYLSEVANDASSETVKSVLSG